MNDLLHGSIKAKIKQKQRVLMILHNIMETRNEQNDVHSRKPHGGKPKQLPKCRTFQLESLQDKLMGDFAHRPKLFVSL